MYFSLEIIWNQKMARQLTAKKLLGGGAVTLCFWIITLSSGTTLHTYSPTNGPALGGTTITITGQEFIIGGSDHSKCRFEAGALASVLGSTNLVLNSTYLICTMPDITSLFPEPLSLGGQNIRLAITAGSGQLSNHVGFFVYNPNSLHINLVLPNQILINISTSVVVIQGHGFLNTGEITCAFAFDPPIVTSAMFDNSTTLQCLLPIVSTPSRLDLVISLNGQLVGAIPASTGVLRLTFFSSPPLVISGYFGSAYTDVHLQFDREVEIGPEEMLTAMKEIQVATVADLLLDCAHVLDNESLLLVTSCAWQNTQQRTIILLLSSNSNVTASSILRLNNKCIRTRHVSYSRLASGIVRVESVFGLELSPSAVLEVPYSIPACGQFVINGDKSFYSGYRELAYKWKVGLDLDEAGNVIPDPTLQGYIPMGYTSHDQVWFQAMAFKGNKDMSGSGDLLLGSSNASYSFQLTVRNEVFKSVSTVVVQNLSRSQLPPLLIVGGRERNVQVWRDVLLEGKVVGEKWACGNEYQNLGYSWTLVNSEGGTIDLEGTRTNTSILLLAPLTMQPGSSYIASCALTVVLHGTDVHTVSASVILIGEEELLAQIIGGTRRSVGVTDSINLDGSYSIVHQRQTTQLVIIWNCTTVSILEWNENISSCGSFVSARGLILSLPAGSLSPGRYMFILSLSLTTQDGNVTSLQSSTSQQIVVFPNLVPSIEIILRRISRLRSVLVHEKFVLEAKVAATMDGVLRWTTEYVEGESYAHTYFVGVIFYHVERVCVKMLNFVLLSWLLLLLQPFLLPPFFAAISVATI